jgi:DNA-binding NtrC family response regulator
VIAATNRDLEADVAAGRFREDLFHRLNVVRLHLPPLRERPDDLVPLLDHFLDRFRSESGRAAIALDADVVARLVAYPWPGNVRELANCARYLVGLARGPTATVEDLPPFLRAPATVAPTTAPTDGPPVRVLDPAIPYKTAKREWTDWFDEQYMARLLDAHGGNVSAAARAAGIDRKSIQRMMKRAAGGDRSDDSDAADDDN